MPLSIVVPPLVLTVLSNTLSKNKVKELAKKFIKLTLNISIVTYRVIALLRFKYFSVNIVIFTEFFKRVVAIR